MLVVPPIAQERTKIDRIVAKVTSKARHRDEIVKSAWKAWMPYHRMRISCTYIATSRPLEVATALNALFSPSATTEAELLQLFRPKHLERPLEERAADATDVIFPHPELDLNALLDRLVKFRGAAQDQSLQVERQLVEGYRKMQWRYLLLPTSTGSLEREEQTSAKLAELRSRSLAVDLCLNLTNAMMPQNLLEHDIFYVPMAVVHLEHGENGPSRYLLVDLTTGKLDAALTHLCELNEDFRSLLELALRPRHSRSNANEKQDSDRSSIIRIPSLVVIAYPLGS